MRCGQAEWLFMSRLMGENGGSVLDGKDRLEDFEGCGGERYLFGTSVPAIMSCNACLRSVKPAMMYPIMRMAPESNFAK
jgi:hypothetical protein